MPSVVEQTPYNEYTANGVTTVYPYEFQLLSADDLVVTIDGVATTDFTLSGVGDQDGGDVTFDTAPANGADVLLSREIGLARDTDYQYNGPLPEATVDRDFNRIWMALQSFWARITGSVRAPYPEQLDELPAAPVRANRILSFDADGQPIAVAPTSGSAADLALRLADTSSASDGDALMGVIKVAYSGAVATTQHEVNEREFDLYDSLTIAQRADYRSNAMSLDLTTRVQAALNSGATVVTMRTGKARVTSKLTKPNTVRIQGAGEQASWIVANHNGTVMECSGVSLVGDAKQGVFDVGFTTTGGSTPAIGLLLENLNQTWLQRVRFEGGYVIGVQSSFCLNSVFDGLSLIDCSDVGLYIYSAGLATGNNRNIYRAFNVNSCGKGIRIDGTGTILSAFDDIGIETCTTPLEIVNGNNIVFNRLYLEANTNNIALLGGDKITFRDCTNVSAQQFINTSGFAASRVVVEDLYDLSGGGIIVNANVMVRDFGQIRFPSTFATSSNVNTLDAFINAQTWTPADASGAGLSITNNGSYYTRIGDMVIAWFDITYPATANGNNAEIGGLPHTSSGIGGGPVVYSTIGTNSATTVRTTNGNSTFFFESVVHTTPTNANLATYRFAGYLIYRT